MSGNVEITEVIRNFQSLTFLGISRLFSTFLDISWHFSTFLDISRYFSTHRERTKNVKSLLGRPLITQQPQKAFLKKPTPKFRGVEITWRKELSSWSKTFTLASCLLSSCSVSCKKKDNITKILIIKC